MIDSITIDIVESKIIKNYVCWGCEEEFPKTNKAAFILSIKSHNTRNICMHMECFLHLALSVHKYASKLEISIEDIEEKVN